MREENVRHCPHRFADTDHAECEPTQKELDVSGKDRRAWANRGAGGGNAVYWLGLIGALVYYIRSADGFWLVVLGILKALVWPAFVVYDLLKFLAG